MATQRTEDVDLTLFATDALGKAVTVAPRPAEQFAAVEEPPAPARSAIEEERISQQCAEMAHLVNTPTDDYQELRVGDRIPLTWPTEPELYTAIVVSTCLWGALVAPQPNSRGVRACKQMYVRAQLDYGPHAGAWCS